MNKKVTHLKMIAEIAHFLIKDESGELAVKLLAASMMMRVP